MSNNDPTRIEVLPTKQLFVSMLTRDISLTPAITDLVDNATDGARRMRGERSLADLEVHLELSSSEFCIFDNCGGIPVGMARDYAFRFGRAPDAPTTPGEVGRFGVGMKRAMFKIGGCFQVISVAKHDSFEMAVDVDEWISEPDWSFHFDKTDRRSHPQEDCGTTIVVTDLHPTPSERFASEAFLTELRRHLASTIRDPLARGFTITVNGVPVESDPLTLIDDSRLRPVRRKLRYSRNGRSKVQIELYCGLGHPKIPSTARQEAGWYVFCNGRLLLEANKTSDTVWGQRDKGTVPAFHNQYNAFRGYAYFTARDAADLPWNTTKTGVDLESPAYRAARLEMMQISRPVIVFLNKVKREKEDRELAGIETRGPLTKAIDNATTSEVEDVGRFASTFSPAVREQRSPRRPRTVGIQYDRPVAQVEVLKKVFRVRSARKVGQKSFDYALKAEDDA